MTNSAFLKQLQLSRDSTVRDAIRVLNDFSMRIVLIVEPHGSLYGTVSDGDIRRGLLRGLNLESPVIEIVNVNPIVVNQDVSLSDAIEMMSKHRIQQIPIIDTKRRPIGIHSLDQINASHHRENRIIIMAGGRGTRLMPMTANTPKPMLPIAGKPILEQIILRVKSEGFSKFVVAIHHLGEQIEAYFGDGSKFGVEIEYLRENKPLGTAGALSLLMNNFDFPLIVTNGDVLTDVRFRDLLDFHIQNQAAATMAVQSHRYQNPFGVVKTNGIEIISYEEKPYTESLINAGVYVHNVTNLSYLERGVYCDMPDLFRVLRSRGLKTIVYPIHEKWIDVGRVEDYDRATTKDETNRGLEN